MKDIAIIPGSSNPKFVNKICDFIGVAPVETNFTVFGNGERQIEINESVRHKDVFVVQSSSDNVNDHIMELFLILDALKRSSCYRVTTVMPNFPYARQDRKVRSRVPISAKLLANLIQTAGTDRFLTAELHSHQISGFFDIPVDNLYASPVFLSFIKDKYPDNNICMVAPDVGSVKTAKMYAGRLGCQVAMIYKNRSAPGEIKEMHLIGEVRDKHCIIIDDMADTCGTLCKATSLVMSRGAKSVEAYCTHAVLSGESINNLKISTLDKLYVTDTIDNKKVELSDKIEVLSIAELFAEAIQGINQEKSLSYLFSM